MTTTMPPLVTIDSHQAAVLHFALGLALESQHAQIKLRGAAPFVQSIALMISACKAEQEKLETAFPRLKNGEAEK